MYRVYVTDDAERIYFYRPPTSYIGIGGLHDDMDSAIAFIPYAYQVIAEDLLPCEPHFAFVTECELETFDDGEVMEIDKRNVFVCKLKGVTP